MTIKFNEERASKVFKILDKLWVKKEWIFKGVVLPQDMWSLPKEPKEIANYFFFCSLAMRGGIISEDPFRWFNELLKRYPEMYDPAIVAKQWNPEKIAKTINEITRIILNGKGNGKKEAGVMGYKLDQHSKNWFANAKVLHEKWGGDLRNVYWGVSDFEEAFRRIDYRSNRYGFNGMRRKIFSLLTIWLQEKKLIDIFPTPLPVDFHCLRVLWVTEIIDIREETTPKAIKEHYPALMKYPSVRIGENFLDEITKWTQKFLEKKRISHLNINPALWVLSRDLCARHIQNSSRGDGKIFFDEPDIIKLSLNYQDPCNYCPVENFCTGAVPAAPYYRRGLLIRFKRMPLITNFLPGINWQNFTNHSDKRTRREGGN